MQDSREAVEDGLMTIPEVMRFLRLSRAAVYNLMADGTLPWTKIGRLRRVPRRSVVEAAASGLRTASPSNG